MPPSPASRHRALALLVLAIAAFVPAPARATLGIFEHGNGIQSMSMGGVSYSIAFETTTLSANPAHALALGNRFDIGLDTFFAEGISTFSGNDAGPDDTWRSDGRSYFFIPQGGYSRRLSDRLGVGITVLNAGLGGDYTDSPYRRFGAGPRVSLGLASTSVVAAVAYRIWPHHTVGFSLNTGYQVLDAKGFEFLANEQASVSPDHVTNQGKDGVFTGGMSIGWHTELTPWMDVGAAYRSRNWTQRHRDYRGLVAEGGKLELPAIFGAGVTVRPFAGWTIALEAQRFDYREQRAFGNGIGELAKGHRLGSGQGPGFGFNDQAAYKVGVSWQVLPSLVIRAGFVHATQIVNQQETLFGVLSGVTGTNQASAGATWTRGAWEFSWMGFNQPYSKVRGRSSIPDALGGGESDIANRVYGAGFSIGRRF